MTEESHPIEQANIFQDSKCSQIELELNTDKANNVVLCNDFSESGNEAERSSDTEPPRNIELQRSQRQRRPPDRYIP